MLLMGIDLGTTNCKLSLYNPEGKEIDSRSFTTPVVRPEPGRAEYKINKMWDKLRNNIRKIADNDKGKLITSIAISSQGESGLLVDKDNQPLTDALAWYDRRTRPIMEKWRQQITDQELYQITGLELNFIHSILKIKWLQQHQPEKFKKADTWHCLSDYFTRKLCGKAVMDYSLASRTMGFNITKKKWSKEIFERFGLPLDIMPKTRPAGSLLGTIKPKLAAELKVNSQAQLVTGGFDHMCGMFGLRANDPQQIVASIGTTESICLYREQPRLSPINKGYSWGCHVFPDAYYQLGGMPSGGEVIDWAVNNILHQKTNKKGYKTFARSVKRSQTGSRGVLFLPHLKGSVTPTVDPESKGGFWGISIDTESGDLCRAILESLAYEFRLLLEHSGQQGIDSIIAMGGGTRNQIWMQHKANILNLPIQVVSREDAVTFGAALLGGKGSDLLTQKQLENLKPGIHKTYRPENEKYNLYNEIYQQVYKNLYQNQKKITQKLNKIL